jgi:hypothetical protein
MSETTIESKGSCLCGAVKFTAKQMGKNVCACHCDMCRKWGGAPFMEVECGSDVLFEGEESITVFDSSSWAERGFCSRCGSHLFYRLKQNNQHMIPVGLFTDDKSFVFNRQVFIDEKPTFYSFTNKTEEVTGAEIFAKYGLS